MVHGTRAAAALLVLSRRLTGLVLGFTGVLGSSCGDEVPSLSWSLRFEPSELSVRARTVTGEVRAGGCSGPVMFSTSILADGESGAAPEPLAPGRYGFHARAEDGQCRSYAQGCQEVELPRREAIEVVLTVASVSTRGCSQALQDSGLAPAESGDADAGQLLPGELPSSPLNPPRETESGDASTAAPPLPRPPPSPSEPVTTSSPGTVYDRASPKCQAQDDAVVACFDFEQSLRDSSARGNHPAQVNASFEPGLSGSALRVSGKRVAIPDAPSLVLAAFTIEAWIRSDGLANLSFEADDRTVLVDKDRQFTLGYDTRGELRVEVHNATATFELIGSDPSKFVTPSVWTYVACTFDGSVASLYKDGERIEARATGLSAARGNGSALHIGSGSPGTTRTFNGLFDALRISSVARSDAAVCAAAGKQLTAGRCRETASPP